MDKKKILVVEDEKAIADILVFNLGREGYDTMAAYDGAEGLHKALTESPDLILPWSGGRSRSPRPLRADPDRALLPCARHR